MYRMVDQIKAGMTDGLKDEMEYKIKDRMTDGIKDAMKVEVRYVIKGGME